jgi:hypothetical protein
MITRLSNAVYKAVKYNKTLNARTRAKFLSLEISVIRGKAYAWELKGGYHGLDELMYGEGYTKEEINSMRVM